MSQSSLKLTANKGELALPANPTAEELTTIQEYLKLQLKLKSKKVDTYQDKIPLTKKLFLFKHKQQESDNWYYRMYCGNRKYKIKSLKSGKINQCRYCQRVSIREMAKVTISH